MSRRAPHESDRALDDPLAGLVRPAGDPAAVRSRCSDFRAAAGELEDIGRLLEAYRRGVGAHWHGEGAWAFMFRSATLPRSYAHWAGVYRAAAAALDGYAGALAEAQRTFDQARGLVVTDDRRQWAILARDPEAVADLLAVDRVRARRMVEAAADRLQVSTRHTKGVVQGLEGKLGKRPPVLPEVVRGPASFRRQAFDEAHDKGAADLADIWATLPILNPTRSAGVAEAMVASTVDEISRLTANPLDYAGSELSDTLDIEELQAGNDARWIGGMTYGLLTRIPGKVFKLARQRHSGDREEGPA